MGLHLVTGGNGFLGAFIVKELVKKGEKVISIDLTLPSQKIKGVDYQVCNVLDYNSLLDVMSGVEYVHHNAALVPLKKAGDLFMKVNIEGTRNVFNAAKNSGVKHFSHMSSSAIFGSISKDDCPINHSTRLSPIEVYGQSKLDGESILREGMAKESGMTCSIIRPRTIIGTERLGIFQILFEWVSEGRNIYIIGNGSNMFQFAHVDDLVDVSIETALNKIPGEFNVGTDRFSTLRDVLESLCEFAGTGSKVVGIPTWLAIPPLYIADKLKISPLAPWHYMTYHKPFYFDMSEEFKQLKWRPKFSNNEMIANSYKWYLENKENLKTADQSSTHRGSLKQGIIGLLKRIS